MQALDWWPQPRKEARTLLDSSSTQAVAPKTRELTGACTPRASLYGESARAVVAFGCCAGTMAAAEATRADKTASFMVNLVQRREGNNGG